MVRRKGDRAMKTLRAIGEWLALIAVITATLFGAALFLAAVDQKSHEPVHVRGSA
jgi:hypothetical protein